ncbi:MAG: prepilin-type N-terminal cleavage/methylation domain-containing protein [Candidatus Zixiibacteriota bacterium]|nr:MAG: prepilin-type N-terminal cleavage/methylation domain-containing protein [candidate division Zixibacteria bacterium]
MNRKTIANQDGITLLEVLVAMIIMGFALLLLLNMAMVALDGNDWSNKTTLVTQLLQEKLEQLRSVRNDNLVSGSDTAQGFSRQWTVTDVGNHLKQIDVKIEWEDIRNQTVTNKMTALVRTDSL